MELLVYKHNDMARVDSLGAYPLAFAAKHAFRDALGYFVQLSALDKQLQTPQVKTRIFAGAASGGAGAAIKAVEKTRFFRRNFPQERKIGLVQIDNAALFDAETKVFHSLVSLSGQIAVNALGGGTGILQGIGQGLGPRARSRKENTLGMAIIAFEEKVFRFEEVVGG